MFLDETDEVKLQRKNNVRKATCHSWFWENPFIPTLGLEIRLGTLTRVWRNQNVCGNIKVFPMVL